jgi:sulfite reductase (NADPH) flavoprotein alpha-component
MPVFKINNQSETAFKKWISSWGNQTGIDLKINHRKINRKIKGLKAFKILAISELNADNTFTIQLKPHTKSHFTSGDLLAVYPDQDGVERLYSIGKIDDEIFLSVKKHENGLVSNLLCELKQEELINAKIKKNYGFHFPTHISDVIMIANGTGIAPFLGMISEHNPSGKVHLFWGGRNEESQKLYAPYIAQALTKQKLSGFYPAYSRKNGSRHYVQDLIPVHKELFKKVLLNDGVIMICGAIAMQNAVLDVLGQLTQTELNLPLSQFEANEQLKMDCY